MDLGVTETDQCPFAHNPDMTGCDCDCVLPRPRGFWPTVRWLFSSKWCTTGPGGSGTGRLPCSKFSEWRRRNVQTA